MSSGTLHSQPPPRPIVLVVGIALDASDDVVWNEAVRLARHGEPAILHVYHAVEPGSPSIQSVADDRNTTIAELRESSLRAYVARRLTELESSNSPSVWIHVAEGRPAEGIAQLAAQLAADAIVIGSVGAKGLKEMDIDVSTALSLFRSSPCSVVLARPKAPSTLAQPVRSRTGTDVDLTSRWLQ